MYWSPLGLFYLSARLKSFGHSVDFLDLNEDDLPDDGIYDQMWFSATSPQISEARRIGQETLGWKTKRILGGPLVWEYPPSAFDLGYDLIVSGEADEPNNCQLVIDSVNTQLEIII